MSEILKFYRDQPNKSGYTYDQVLGWSNQDLEMTHDFIQWLFPTDQPSRFNHDAELVTYEVAMEFRQDQNLRARIELADQRLRDFLFQGGSQAKWIRPGNHNLLRISRIIRSLVLLHSRERAKQFLDDMLELADRPALAKSVEIWKSQVNSIIGR